MAGHVIAQTLLMACGILGAQHCPNGIGGGLGGVRVGLEPCVVLAQPIDEGVRAVGILEQLSGDRLRHAGQGKRSVLASTHVAKAQ